MQALMPNAALDVREEIQMDLVATTLREFGAVRFIARGSSMIPFICPGDLLTVRSTPPSCIAVGDVVLSSRKGRFYVHRLLRIWGEGTRFQTQGDALRYPDPAIDAGQLLGCVIGVERHGKQVQRRGRLSNHLLVALVRRSEFIAKAFLHGHAVRTRLSTAPAGGRAFEHFLENL
jgi:peptidase S24-like protein